VFAGLAGVEAECDRMRRDAAQTAAQRRAEAADRAQVMVARARGEAAAIRAAVAARIREDTAAELAQLGARTTAEADELRRRSARRLPELVSMVVERVREDLTTLDGSALGGPDGEPG
jgi:vacuolar-type H+-ATPase subunit E/Vma4